MHYSTLIEVTTLAAELENPAWVILDCRFDLTRPDWGETEFAAGHIPGAQYAHLDRDLASPPSESSGRHPLPTPETFAALASRWGVDRHTQVVVHDQSGGVFAARAWWLFRWLGHERVALLDGGLAAWRSAGLPLETTVRPRSATHFTAQPGAQPVASVEDIVAALGSTALHLVDARGADRFAGQNETMDPRAGHVPGAVNHHYALNLSAEGRLQDAATLRERWLATLAGRDPKDMVAMCGSGVSACLNLLSMEVAGLPGARLYPGSWSEWVKDPSRPIAQ